MQKAKMKTAILIILLLIPNISFSNDVLSEIQDSHISANLPDTFEEFERILKRDLEKYFQNRHQKSVSVEYQLLRKGPTQSGVAYPKFYAWVEVIEKNNIIESGAIRIASIEKNRIEVTNFVTKDQILKNPTQIESVFPKSLCDGIITQANIK